MKTVYVLQSRELINPVNNCRTSITENEYRLLRRIHKDELTKKEICEIVWEDRSRVVSDSSYYQLLSYLRASLARVGVADVIKTIPRHGVAFLCLFEQKQSLGAGFLQKNGKKPIASISDIDKESIAKIISKAIFEKLNS